MIAFITGVPFRSDIIQRYHLRPVPTGLPRRQDLFRCYQADRSRCEERTGGDVFLPAPDFRGVVEAAHPAFGCADGFFIEEA
jgi:hypothetical protein